MLTLLALSAFWMCSGEPLQLQVHTHQPVSLQARQVYNELVHKLQATYMPDKVAQGTFGAMMQVSLVNDVRPAACSCGCSPPAHCDAFMVSIAHGCMLIATALYPARSPAVKSMLLMQLHL